MKIEIIVDETMKVASQTGPSVEITQVAMELADALPGLLAAGKKSLSAETEVYRFGEDETGHPVISVIVTDIDPSIHDVIVMPYDKVWRVIIDWFSDQRLLLPSTFRYDTGEHGMSNNKDGSYQSW